MILFIPCIIIENIRKEDVSFMKALKKAVLAAVTIISASYLGACSRNEGIGLKLDNGNENFITSDYVNVTNQEAFEAMIMSMDVQTRTNNGVLALLDMVDKDLLIGTVEVDREEIIELVEQLKEQSDNFEEDLLSQGIASEEDLINYFELVRAREAAVRATIEVTEEEIEDAYNLMFGIGTEDETSEDEEEAEEETEEIPTLDEVRETIREELIRSQLTNAFFQTELARLREEAGFVILDSYLQEQYVAFLEMNGVDVESVFTTTSRTDRTIVAELGENQYTVDQLFAELAPTIGLTSGISIVDPIILDEHFDVSDDEVNELLNELKISWGDQFFPTMAQMGFNDTQAIFNHLKLISLQELAFNEANMPSEERLKELYNAYEPNISVRHILVDEEDFAKELIERLQEADDKEALFIELAEEYSNCPSAADGGDLNSFGRGAMVPTFEEAAFGLEVGEITTEPVETSHGFHIIYKYDVAETPAFEDIRESLEEQELSTLRTPTRLEAALLPYREEANFKFTDSHLQARYDLIASNIRSSLEESNTAE